MHAITIFIFLLFILHATCATSSDSVCNIRSIFSSTVTELQTSQTVGGISVQANAQFLVLVERQMLRNKVSEMTAKLMHAASRRVLWTRRLRSQEKFVLSHVRVSDEGNVFLVGMFDTYLEVDDLIIAKGFVNGVVLSFSVTGDLRWYLAGKSRAMDFFNDVAVDDANNVYVCGLFMSETSIGDKKLKSSGYGDALLFKLNGVDGKVEWATSFGGKRADSATAIVVQNDIIYVSGYVAGNVTFAPGKKVVVPREYNEVALIAEFDRKQGAFVNAQVKVPTMASLRTSRAQTIGIYNKGFVVTSTWYDTYGRPMVQTLSSATWTIQALNTTALMFDASGHFLTSALETSLQIGTEFRTVPKYAIISGMIENGQVTRLQIDANPREAEPNSFTCTGNQCFFAGEQIVLGSITNECKPCPPRSYAYNNKCIVCPDKFIVEQERCIKMSSAINNNQYAWSALVLLFSLLALVL